MSLFDCTSDVFDDAAALEPTYQPEHFVLRDEVIEDYVSALQPLAEGRAGQHIFVHGRPGTGKSATTRFLLDELQNDIEASTNHSLGMERIVASAGSSSFKMLIKAVNDLRASRNETPISTTGHSTAEVVSTLLDELASLNDPLVLVVDDAHLISNPDVLFRELSRVRERTGDSHADLTVIAISNGASTLDELSADTRSTLRTKRLLFPSFSKEELTTILEQRAQAGFKPDVKWKQIIDLCSAQSRRDGGDVRYAINLLRVAGENAQERLRTTGETTVEIRHEDVIKAEDALSSEWYYSTVCQLDRLPQQALYGVIEAACVGKTPCSTGEVHRRLTTMSTFDEITEGYVRNQLNTLVSQELVLRTSINRGGKSDGSGGQRYTYEVPVSLPTALTALAEMGNDLIDQERLEKLVRNAHEEGKISDQQKGELF